METILDPLFDEMSDGVCVTDRQGKILYLNPAARRTLELEGGEAEAKSKLMCELLCGRMAAPGGGTYLMACPLRSAAPDQKAVTFQGRFGPQTAFEWRDSRIHRFDQYKDLRVRCVRVKTALFDSWETEKHFMLIEDAGPEAELQRHREDWRSMITHDLRAPITNISGTFKVLDGLPPGRVLDAAGANLVKIGLRSAERLLDLLDLYLEVAKLDAGFMPVRLREVVLTSPVRRCAEEQAALAASHGVAVEVSVAPELVVMADHDLLFRVVENLLNNALKYTPGGGKVLISAAAEPGGKVALSFQDTGHGIAPEDLPFIFDRYFQARARREGRIQGNGLGLTFCLEAMKAMCGTISVESEPGVGSDFTVRLPPAAAPAAKKEGGAP